MLRKTVTIKTEKQFTDLTQIAKDFVKESFYDMVSFVTNICK